MCSAARLREIVRLIDDDDIPGCLLQRPQDTFLFGEVDRGDNAIGVFLLVRNCDLLERVPVEPEQRTPLSPSSSYIGSGSRFTCTHIAKELTAKLTAMPTMMSEQRRTRTNVQICPHERRSAVKVRREVPGTPDNGDLTQLFARCDTISIKLFESSPRTR